MGKCRIMGRVVTNGPQAYAVMWCDEHDMPAYGEYPMCPIGGIEEATERAIARIGAVAAEQLHGYVPRSKVDD
ncbi:MAG TPA: hypothetical protein VKB76_05880 [Ktedonobacterales bacterium]|nr:hypothetical protein [Ktedonobacterales bacterium]